MATVWSSVIQEQEPGYKIILLNISYETLNNFQHYIFMLMSRHQIDEEKKHNLNIVNKSFHNLLKTRYLETN